MVSFINCSMDRIQDASNCYYAAYGFLFPVFLPSVTSYLQGYKVLSFCQFENARQVSCRNLGNHFCIIVMLLTILFGVSLDVVQLVALCKTICLVVARFIRVLSDHFYLHVRSPLDKASWLYWQTFSLRNLKQQGTGAATKI